MKKEFEDISFEDLLQLAYGEQREICQFWNRKRIKVFYKKFGFIPKSPRVIVTEKIKKAK